MTEPGDERLAVARLELVELGAIEQSGDHLVDVIALAQVATDRAVHAVRVVGERFWVIWIRRRDQWRTGRGPVPWRVGSLPIEAGDDLTPDRERVLVVQRLVVCDATD